MKFGPVPVAEAEGAILAHSRRAGGRMLKKGHVLSKEDVAALAASGIAEVVAARLEPGDVGEDAAANRIAAAVTGEYATAQPAFTGRSNLFAAARGLMVVDRDRLDRLNAIDEGITVATLAPFEPVEPRRMIATVKIIPFAVPETNLARCLTLAGEAGPLIRVAPFRARSAGLVQTTLADTKPSVLDKTTAVTRQRLESLGSRLDGEVRCAHDEAEVAAAIRKLRAEGRNLVLVVGASAITDRRDVIPAGIVAAGGRIEHFGMPVDPGNLLLLGRFGDGDPVLGLPGCARSPKLNGVDWVLQRLAADLPLTARDIMAMGGGGLLVDTPARPLPRAEAGAPPAERIGDEPRVTAVVLAAGQSRRMGSANKLLLPVDGAPMVVRAVDAVLASRASALVVVLGHEAERVRAVLAGRQAMFVENPDYAEGLSTSLRRGLAAVPAEADAVLVCLGDMPRISAVQIDRLIAAFNPQEGRAICLPTHRGKRGNPVLWARRFLPEMMEVAGDVGARHLLGDYADHVCEVEMEESVLLDIDTPEALKEATA